jgi:hypothetical protein
MAIQCFGCKLVHWWFKQDDKKLIRGFSREESRQEDCRGKKHAESLLILQNLGFAIQCL